LFTDLDDYWPVPDMLICTLNVDIPEAVLDTASEIVAAVDCPDANTAPFLFQLIDSGPLADEGFQLLVARLKDRGVPPVFFM
jgi:hypothetical protein